MQWFARGRHALRVVGLPLAAGTILHTLGGPVRVEDVEEAGSAVGYNLVVAASSSYFVGDKGVMVHDNTPREPTTAILPGLLAESH